MEKCIPPVTTILYIASYRYPVCAQIRPRWYVAEHAAAHAQPSRCPVRLEFTPGVSENFLSSNIVHGTALSRHRSLIGEKDLDIGVVLWEAHQPLLEAVVTPSHHGTTRTGVDDMVALNRRWMSHLARFELGQDNAEASDDPRSDLAMQTINAALHALEYSEKDARLRYLLHDALSGSPSFFSLWSRDCILTALGRRSSIGANELPMSPQVPSSEHQEENVRFPGSKVHVVPVWLVNRAVFWTVKEMTAKNSQSLVHTILISSHGQRICLDGHGTCVGRGPWCVDGVHLGCSSGQTSPKCARWSRTWWRLKPCQFPCCTWSSPGGPWACIFPKAGTLVDSWSGSVVLFQSDLCYRHECWKRLLSWLGELIHGLLLGMTWSNVFSLVLRV